MDHDPTIFYQIIDGDLTSVTPPTFYQIIEGGLTPLIFCYNHKPATVPTPTGGAGSGVDGVGGAGGDCTQGRGLEFWMKNTHAIETPPLAEDLFTVVWIYFEYFVRNCLSFYVGICFSFYISICFDEVCS
ncbi:hypothetical protein L6452_03046 [Arctium lappa]|uniref:Uncharacterized protein n=1 Tax=Arctium lappa TaxID=4217 RepID=A0ACB9FLZ6_ARCLA|nr:hypothetical protein L6452_03046 [Arctium lappa]